MNRAATILQWLIYAVCAVILFVILGAATT